MGIFNGRKDKERSISMEAMTIEKNLVFKEAMQDKALSKTLREWHKRKQSQAGAGQTFRGWVDGLLDYLAGQLGDSPVTHSHLLAALRVNAAGDPLAVTCAGNARHDGFTTDTNCFVEEGKVCSNVWVSGKTAEENRREAETIRDIFRKAGYDSEVWIDSEDDTDCTVNSYKKFPLYYKKRGSSDDNTRPPCRRLGWGAATFFTHPVDKRLGVAL